MCAHEELRSSKFLMISDKILNKKHTLIFSLNQLETERFFMVESNVMDVLPTSLQLIFFPQSTRERITFYGFISMV